MLIFHKAAEKICKIKIIFLINNIKNNKSKIYLISKILQATIAIKK